MKQANWADQISHWLRFLYKHRFDGGNCVQGLIWPKPPGATGHILQCLHNLEKRKPGSVSTGLKRNALQPKTGHRKTEEEDTRDRPWGGWTLRQYWYLISDVTVFFFFFPLHHSSNTYLLFAAPEANGRAAMCTLFILIHQNKLFTSSCLE